MLDQAAPQPECAISTQTLRKIDGISRSRGPSHTASLRRKKKREKKGKGASKHGQTNFFWHFLQFTHVYLLPSLLFSFLKKDEEKREGEGGQVNIWALGKQTFDGKILQFTHALYIHFIIY